MNTNTIANIALIIMGVVVVYLVGVSAGRLNRAASLIEHNPCNACIQLTDYVCVNKTDPGLLYWMPSTEWKNNNLVDSGEKWALPENIQRELNIISNITKED